MTAMAVLATVVDTEALWQAIAAAFVAGIGVTLAFSLAVLGLSGFVEASRDGRSAAAFAFGALTVAGLLATAGVIAAGLIVMTSG
jgi:hypothetical protein